MKKIVALGTVLASMLAASQAFAGPTSLQSATITATYNASDVIGYDYFVALLNNASTLPSLNVSALSGYDNSPEFMTADGLFQIDFSASGLVTVYNAVADVPAGTYTLNFDFSGISENISSFLATNTSTITGTPLLTVSNAHSVSLNLSGITWGASDANSFTAQLGFTSAVPEPAVPAMLIAGLGMLGLARRQQA